MQAFGVTEWLNAGVRRRNTTILRWFWVENRNCNPHSQTKQGQHRSNLLQNSHAHQLPIWHIPECMTNTRLIYYLQNSGILDRGNCGFDKHCSIMDHLVSFERYVRHAFAEKQAHGLLLTWCRPMRKPAKSGQNRDNTLWWILSRRRCLNWWYYGCYVFWRFGVKINDMPLCIARVIIRAPLVDDLANSGCSMDTTGNICNRLQIPYWNGQPGMKSGLQPISAKLHISLHPGPRFKDCWHTSANG